MAKQHTFKFKSTKGQDVTIDYKPEGVTVNDEKAFQGHLLKVVDFIQVDDKPKEKPTLKGIEEVAEEAEEAEETKEEIKEEPKKTITNEDLFGGK